MRLMGLPAAVAALALLLAAPAGTVGGEIAFEAAGRIYLAAADGSRERPVGIPPDASWPAWSADGRRLAFTSVRRGGLFVARPDGSGLRRVTRSPTLDVQPAWSPDGRRIAFARAVPGFCEEIFTVGIDGRGLRRLTRSRGQDLEPDWAPNGKRIAWASTSTATRFAQPFVRTVSPDGTAIRSVMPGAAPDWSPDGQRFAFSLRGELFTGEVSGRGRVKVTSSPEVADTRPDWSPDGTQLAFLSSRGSPRERPRVFVVPAAGGEGTLVSPREPAGAPTWRP